MLDFQQKRKFKQFFYSRVTLVFLLIFIIFIANQVYGIYEKQKLSKENLSSVKNQYEELKNREKMLTSEIDRLKTKEGMEEEIRNKFDVAKPGEQVVVITDDGSSTKVVKEENGTISGLWNKVVGWFK